MNPTHYHVDDGDHEAIAVDHELDVRDLSGGTYYPVTMEALDGLFREATDMLDERTWSALRPATRQ